MYVERTSITERLEDHLNSSSDSIKNDDSFDEYLTEVCPPKTMEEIRKKQYCYSNLRRKINTKKKEFEEDKSSSMWKSVYYTFFGNQHTNLFTVNELELRCKFLYNMRKNDKYYFPNYNKPKIDPYINIEKFIKYYLDKKDDNFVLNLLKKKAMADPEEMSLKKRSNSANVLRRKSKLIKDTLERRRKTITDLNRHGGSILEMYNVKESNELVEIINVIQAQYKKNKDKDMLENLNNILDNKHSFQVEQRNVNMILNEDSKYSNIIKNFINFKTNDPFFLANKDVDLISKYESQLDPQNRLSQKVNLLCDKVLNKIDCVYKVNK